MSAKRETPLTREEILTVAQRIVDEEGADGLSMRRLARELGVEAMSLYHHVPNKDAIVEGVIELSLLAQVAPPAAEPPRDWKAPVLASVLGFRRALVSHPNVLPMIAAHPPVTTGTVPYIEAPMGYLVSQGFSPTDASDLFSAVFSLAFGHAMLSTNYGQITLPNTPMIEFTEESFARTVGVILDGYEGCRAEAPAAGDAEYGGHGRRKSGPLHQVGHLPAPVG